MLGLKIKTNKVMTRSNKQTISFQKGDPYINDAKYLRLLESAPDAMVIVDREGAIVLANKQAEVIFGYSRKELLGKPVEVLLPEAFRAKHPLHRANYMKAPHIKITGHGLSLTGLRKDQSEFPVEINLSPLETEEVLFIASIRDITERKAVEEQLRQSEKYNRQLFTAARKRLSQTVALRNIDKAISNSLDLEFTLDIVITQAINELQVDAAEILLYDPTAHMLEIFVAKGFQTLAVEHIHMPLGKGFAGRAILERKRIDIADLRKESTDFLSHPDIALEGFIDYHVIPLVAKGKVVGAMATYNRSTFVANPDWLEFLESLASQAAIAIDSISLFERLQSANDELVLGYDATIEGWSRALDLRDKETEGHTQRVATSAITLARKMGVSNEQLVNVRRGALLHDIGKMGVPDSVLLKPSELSEQEWAVMKRHPQHAHDMLSPIKYLQEALDIPFCHHEKWDGSGYPRGLEGDRIPFTARIFAVVDVYDALTCDRPYRKAWPKTKALEYIKNQSGRHFDPAVVQAFVEQVAVGHLS